MKKSELQQLIQESIQEVLCEVTLYQDVRSFLSKISDPKQQKIFANWIIPVLSKSAEDPNEKAKYIAAVRAAIIDPHLAKPWIKNHLKNIGIDLDDTITISNLKPLIPILDKLQQYVRISK